MNRRLFRQTLRWLRARTLVLALVGFGWGTIMPVVFNEFSDAIRDLANSGVIPEALMNFGSGSLFTLTGTVTLALQHPIAIALLGVIAVEATASAIAGERERGTLEVLLARPIARTALYWSILVAMLLAIAVILVAILGGMFVSALLIGIADELEASQMPLVVLNGFGLWAAFATFGLAASVSFDRAGPAVGMTLGWLLLHYFLEILGSLWTDVAWTQQYSLLHHFNPGRILEGALDPLDLVIVFVAALVPIAYALYVFPQRDLPAPA